MASQTPPASSSDGPADCEVPAAPGGPAGRRAAIPSAPGAVPGARAPTLAGAASGHALAGRRPCPRLPGQAPRGGRDRRRIPAASRDDALREARR